MAIYINSNMNKILLTMLMAFTLSACTLFPQKFDNYEHAKLANIAIDIEYLREKCNSNENEVRFWLKIIERDVRVVELYSRHIPQNSEVHNVIVIVKEDVGEFKKRYIEKGHSTSYCEIKADLMHKKVTRILEATGKKPRN